jgi:HAD superfamily, subfamily IIIB (Acid phosphatase)
VVRRPIAILGVLAVSVSAAVALGAPPSGIVRYAAESDHSHYGLRPTGVGLPQIGMTGTAGAGELASNLRTYHDSGRYGRDLSVAGDAARAYLAKRLAQNLARPRRVKKCGVRYRRVHHRLKGRKLRKIRLYRRVRKCRRRVVTPPRFHGRPAIVLDIDETSLSNYSGLTASNFSGTGTVAPVAAGTGTAIGPILNLYRYARSHGVAVFFVTGRPSIVNTPTVRNLRNVGYTKGWSGLYYKPGSVGVEAFKAGRRAAFERAGNDVVVNVGDQESDLDGGHADRAFKLPNPFYFIAD